MQDHERAPAVAPAPPESPDPPVTAGVLRRLHPSAVRLWRLVGLAEVATLVAAAAAALRWLEPPVHPVLPPAGILALGILYVALRPPSRYRAWGYELRPGDVRIRHGVWWRTVTIVPHVRIQHVDTRQGPLERMLGLATLVLFTAGTVGAAVEIPGLAVAEAERLREHLALLSGTDDAV